MIILGSLEARRGLPISVNWTFFARSCGWGATSDYWFKIGDISLQHGPVVPKFQVEEVAPTNHSPSQKTTINDLSHGMKIWTDFSSALSQFTHLTDRRTDRILIARTRLHSMQRGKQVAQLSQRDRAAGWVSNGQKWKTGTERQYLRTI